MEAIGMIETRGLLAAIESADAMLKAAEVRLLERTFVGGGLVTITVTGDVAAVKASIDAAAASVTRLGTELLVSQHVIPRPHSELGETILSPIPLSERSKQEPEKEPAPKEKAEEKTEIRSMAQEPEREPEKPVKQESEQEQAQQPEETQTELQDSQEEQQLQISDQEKPEEELQEQTPEQEEEPESQQVEEEVREDQLQTNASQMHKADMDRMVEVSGLDKAIETLEKCKVVKLRNLAREYEDFGIAGRLISKANKTALLEEFRRYYTEK